MEYIIPVVEKAAIEVYPLSLSWVSPDLDTGETISTAVVTVAPAGLTIGVPTISGSSVIVFISGGAVGTDYTVLFKITTSGGKTFGNPHLDALIVRVI